jgi:hypothetical protein
MLRNEVDAGVKSCQLALDTMLRVLRDPDKVEWSDPIKSRFWRRSWPRLKDCSIRTWKANASRGSI